MKTHRTKEGKELLISEMSNSHLLATIALYRRKAKAGITIERGGGSCPDDFWYDTEVVKDRTALDYLNYDEYVKEAKRRNLQVPV